MSVPSAVGAYAEKDRGRCEGYQWRTERPIAVLVMTPDVPLA